MCGIRPESLVSPEQVAPFFVKLNSFFGKKKLRYRFVDDELSPIMGIDKRSTSGAVEARSSPVASDLRFHASRTLS